MVETKFTMVNPTELAEPLGYSNGVSAPVGKILFVAGQIGWNRDKQLVGESFAAQFEQALANVLAVVKAADGTAGNIGKFTIYVTDKQQYLAEIKEVGIAYRKLMGRYFPAMALVEVKALLEPGAKVEIEAMAVI